MDLQLLVIAVTVGAKFNCAIGAPKIGLTIGFLIGGLNVSPGERGKASGGGGVGGPFRNGSYVKLGGYGGGYAPGNIPQPGGNGELGTGGGGGAGACWGWVGPGQSGYVHIKYLGI